MDLLAFSKNTELMPGCVVDFIDRTGKIRTMKIIDRNGDTVTVIDAYHKELYVKMKSIFGYWNKNTPPVPKNRINLHKEK